MWNIYLSLIIVLSYLKPPHYGTNLKHCFDVNYLLYIFCGVILSLQIVFYRVFHLIIKGGISHIFNLPFNCDGTRHALLLPYWCLILWQASGNLSNSTPTLYPLQDKGDSYVTILIRILEYLWNNFFLQYELTMFISPKKIVW